MAPALLLAAVATAGGLRFWFFHRKRVYRARDWERSELNRMHKHTAVCVALCLAVLIAGAWIPVARIPLVVSASLMLLLILPVRTVMIELGFRYRQSNIHTVALDQAATQKDG